MKKSQLIALWTAGGLLFSCSSPEASKLHETYGQIAMDRESALRPCQQLSSPGNAYLRQLMDDIISANQQTFQNQYQSSSFCISIDNNPAITASSEPRDGGILISQGLIHSAPNDAAISAVISHELAHITMDHNSRSHPLLESNKEWREARDALSLVSENLFDTHSPEDERQFADALQKLDSIRDQIISPEVDANWREEEADNIGLKYYLNASLNVADFSWIFTALMSYDEYLQCIELENSDELSKPTIHRGLGPHPHPCWRIKNFENQLELAKTQMPALLQKAKRRDVLPGVLLKIKSKL